LVKPKEEEWNRKIRPLEERHKPPYKSVGVSSNLFGQYFLQQDLSNSENDKIIPWDDPLLQRPILSWPPYPSEPSPQLKNLVQLFSSTD